MTICLNMIVRDEEALIAQTLRNVCERMPIAYWVICDTGSKDGTREIVRQTMAELGIPGELHEHPWVDFAANRNRALALCAGKGDYVFFFDADDRLEGRMEARELTAGAYSFRMLSENRPVHFTRKLLVRNDGTARWRGVLHEFLDVTGLSVAEIGGDLAVVARSKGVRSRDPEKYRNDALALERAFAAPGDENLKPRYAFYCANSWRNCGEDDRALEWYRRRTGLGGWSDERYLAHLEAGLILERGGDRAGALDHMLAGHDVAPDRAECLYHASRILRHQARFRSALIFAREGIAIPKPVGNRLFVNNAIYDHWLAYELVFLTARTGGNPRALPHYARFLASDAPERDKRTIAAL